MSATRSRFGDYAAKNASRNGEHSSKGLGMQAIGPPLPYSKSFGSGSDIWASSFGNRGSGDAAKLQDKSESNLGQPDAITGSRSLLPSSESDGWGWASNSQWPSMNNLSTSLAHARTDQSNVSPLRQRTTQNTRSNSPFFSSQTAAIGQGAGTKSASRSFLDPTSRSFNASGVFNPSHHSNGIVRQNSDDSGRRGLTDIVFGSTSNGFSVFPGYASSAASRSGSLPPSRHGIDQFAREEALPSPHTMNGSDPSSQPSNQLSRTSTASTNGIPRLNMNPYTQFGELAAGFASSNMDREGNDSSYAPYPNYFQQLPPSNSCGFSNYMHGHRNGPASLEPDSRVYPPATSYSQVRSPLGSRFSHLPNENDTIRHQDSGNYFSLGTPPLPEQSHFSRNHAGSQSAAAVKRKLRNLQEQQQQYNPYAFAQKNAGLNYHNPYSPSQYDYAVQSTSQINPQAQYLPPLPMNSRPTTTRLIKAPPRGPASEGECLRSTLLDEFRTNKPGHRHYELRDIYNHVVEFCGDQHGSRFIQQKLETANSDEKEQLFREILPNCLQLTTDVFGNYVIQKFFEQGNQSQKKILAAQMKGNIAALSTQPYGCRVVQKAFEHILTDQQASLVKELEHCWMKCAKDHNGNHVVQKAIERIPVEHVSFILNGWTGHALDLAKHTYGCRIIQRILEYAPEASRSLLLDELHTCALNLITDEFGNYVIQHIIRHGRDQDRTKIFNLVMAQLYLFTRDKYASNVVEACIEFSNPKQSEQLIDLLTLPGKDEESSAQYIMCDRFGNYVIQKLLKGLSEENWDAVTDRCKARLPKIKRNGEYGKQIIEIEKLLYGPRPTRKSPGGPATLPPELDGTSIATPTLTEDNQSPRTSSLPSTNTSTADGPIGESTAKPAAQSVGVVVPMTAEQANM